MKSISKILGCFVVLFMSIPLILLSGCGEENFYNDNRGGLNGKIVYGHSGDVTIYDIASKSTRTLKPINLTSKYASYPIWSGHNIAVTVRDTLSGLDYVEMLSDTGSNSSILIKNNDEHCGFPSLSSNKSKIALLCGHWKEDLGRIDYRLAIIGIDGSGINVVPQQVLPYKPSWSNNGESVAVVDLNKNIILVDYTKMTADKVTEGISPSFSPDGKSLAFFRQDQDSNKSSLVLLNLSTNKEKVINKSNIFDNSPEWSSDGKWVLYQRYGFILLPPERAIVEAYSIEQNKSFKIFETRNPIQGFSLANK